VIWTFTWASYSFDVCDVILKLSAFKLIAIVFNASVDSDETLIKLIMIIFNASIDSNEISIMKVSNFKMLVEMLFFDDLFTNLCSERMLNVCLQSYKFMSSFFLSLTNLTAWFLIIQLKSETQKQYCLSIFFTYFMKTSNLSLFMNLSHLSLTDNDLRLMYE